MGRASILFLLSFLISCSCARALDPSLDINQYAHKTWTIRDGFFKGTISTVTQTPDGYLWVGTEFGLFRFDGVHSVAWEPPGPAQLPASNITRLLAARDGRLWIATTAGLASWKDGRLTAYPELAGKTFGSLLEDREGAIWAGSVSGSAGELCAIQGVRARCYGSDGTFAGGVISLYQDSRGTLWAGAISGLWQWLPGPPRVYPIASPAHEIRSLIEGDAGTLWIAMRSGIRRLVNGKVEPYSLPAAGQFSPNRMLRDRDGSLWIGTTDHGLLHMHHGRTDSFTAADGLSGDRANGFYEDREGNIWVNTDDGLDRFRDFAVATISAKQGLSDPVVWSTLAARDGSVWVGTPNGLNRWNGGKVTIYRTPEGLPYDDVSSLFEDDRGRIVVSTLRGVARLEEGRFVPLRSVPGGVVHNIVEANDRSIWINDQERGLLHVLDRGVVQRIPWDSLGGRNFASALLADPAQGGLWLGFFQGGLAWFSEGRVRASYPVVDGVGHGLVSALQLDPDGTLWAATEGGLSRLKNGRVATLTSRNGLPCDPVHWMLEDNDASFWLFMPCGLARISRRDIETWSRDPKHAVTATVFDASDGVRGRASPGGYTPHAGKSPDGRLWFNTVDGLSIIDPRHLPFNKIPPPVQIEQIIADRNRSAASPHLRLPPLVRDLEIDYTALSLVAPEKIHFKYKLEGHDPDWQDSGNRRQAFYNDLPPRNYRFRVIADNNSGVWNQAGAAFDFSIAPAWYQTRWFQASSLAALLALLWGSYRYRLHQIARQFNVRMEERVAERTRIARDLHDTLLQGFQGLMLRLQVVEELLPPGKAKQELELTLQRADQAIVEGRNAVHDLRSSAAVTNDLPEVVRAMGDELATDAAAFRLVVEGPVRDLHPIIRDELYRIAREALRNAFTHARARQVETEITYADNLFRLRIRDDGAGIAREILEDGRTGHFGLPGMRERAAQIGGKLNIWSGVGTGTEIDVSIPGSLAYSRPSGRSRLRIRV